VATEAEKRSKKITALNDMAFAHESHWQEFKARCREEEEFKRRRDRFNAGKVKRPASPSCRVIHDFKLLEEVEWTGHNQFVYQDAAWLQLETAPVAGYENDVVFLRGIWVEPINRRDGWLSHILDLLKDICTDAGASILLSACPFENDSDCLNPAADTFQHYDPAIRHVPEELAFFSIAKSDLEAAYLKRGFVFVQMLESDDAEEMLIRDGNLIVRPGTIERDRLNPMIWFSDAAGPELLSCVDVAHTEYMRIRNSGHSPPRIATAPGPPAERIEL
jgi:hypothetical protein